MKSVLALVLTLTTLAACTSPEPPTDLNEAVETSTASETPAFLTDLNLADALQLGFEPGSTRLEVEGQLAAGESAEFVVGAHSGDLLMAHAITPEGDLTVSVFRLDSGAPLADSSPSPAFWSGILPSSIGYLVKLEPPANETLYSLQIEIPRLLDSREKLSISGIASPHLPVAYRVHAESQERLRLDLTSPQGASFAVHGLDSGHPLVPWSDGATSFEGTAPENQEYIIHVIGTSEPAEFELTVLRG